MPKRCIKRLKNTAAVMAIVTVIVMATVWHQVQKLSKKPKLSRKWKAADVDVADTDAHADIGEADALVDIAADAETL
jgi:hypothetical protein